jgi:hypothetical protein
MAGIGHRNSFQKCSYKKLVSQKERFMEEVIVDSTVLKKYTISE